MPINELHRRVATVALRVATRYGFALGGGNALIAHGLITRPTQDVDLFTNEETGVEAAADSVETALREAGFDTDREDKASGLPEIFEGMGEGLAEWTVTARDGQQMMLQMAYFDRTAQPVTMDVGPVLRLEDVVGGKVCALAGRAEPRDYIDTAAALAPLQHRPGDRPRPRARSRPGRPRFRRRRAPARPVGRLGLRCLRPRRRGRRRAAGRVPRLATRPRPRADAAPGRLTRRLRVGRPRTCRLGDLE